MPQYVYLDDETGFEKEVWHNMNECDNPSEATLKEITHEGRIMRRIPQLTGMTCSAGISRSGAISNIKQMTDGQKKDFIKNRLKRSSDHFKKSGGAEQKHIMTQEFKSDARQMFGVKKKR